MDAEDKRCPLLDAAMQARIARSFEISSDPENPGQLRVYNKDRQLYMRWSFESEDGAMSFIASTLLEDDERESKCELPIDPRLEIIRDFDGDFVIFIRGPVCLGTFGRERSALPLAADISRALIREGYYTDPSDPRWKDVGDNDDDAPTPLGR